MSKRLSLILTDGDQEQMEPFIRAGTGQHKMLTQWANEHGVNSVTSEAAALRVLLRAGLEAIRADALEAGYTELAKTHGGSTERDERRSARDHYVNRTESLM